MRMFLDCEFNGHGGELISLALVAEDGDSFYEVLDCHETLDPWVLVNVMPVLGKSPTYMKIFQRKLGEFLLRYDKVHVVADWPADISYLCRALLLKPDKCMATPPMTFEVRSDNAPPGSAGSGHIVTVVMPATPHNALSDAIALKQTVLEYEYETTQTR